MAVAFDAVGPSSAGAGSTGATTLSWNHTTVAASTYVLAGVALDAGFDTPFSMTCTCDGTGMVSLGRVESGGLGEGYLQVWYITGIAAGSHTILATASGGTPDDLTGGSMSFSGATGLGTAYTSTTSATGTTASVVVTSNTSGNIIAGFIGSGANITASGNTSQFINNLRGGAGDAVGNAGGSTGAATGSAVTMSWSTTSTVAAALGIEVQGAPPVALGPPLLPLPGSRPVIAAFPAGRTGAGHSL